MEYDTELVARAKNGNTYVSRAMYMDNYYYYIDDDCIVRYDSAKDFAEIKLEF